MDKEDKKNILCILERMHGIHFTLTLVLGVLIVQVVVSLLDFL